MARVLVVDDDPDLLTLVQMQLKHRGHDVWTASSGPAAIALLDERGAPDVAVLDVAMPGMNGIDLLHALRTTDGFEELPAIFLSARVGPEDIALGTSLGALYLTKPYAMKALLAAIDEQTRELATTGA
jgi:DNA-binding response OmpR family regulator